MEKVKSPITKSPPGVNLNLKTSITCTNVPESLFEPTATKKHFSKFGRVKRIRLFPKKQTCIVEYELPSSVEQAVLNAGAYDGFMFDVTRVKPRVRRKSKRDDDPDWVPDSDVEEELSAMGGGPWVTRQSRMDTSPEKIKPVSRSHFVNPLPLRKKAPVREKPVILQPKSIIESPVIVVSQTTLSTSEAASELHQLRYKISQTPDEQWRILDARDRILRAWGGAGARVKIGGATIGTCPDMCPEKERLHRQAEHQVMSLETVPDCDYQLEIWRAVKQYSRSSADQEIPMCYELRPPVVLERTCAYLLCEIADTTRQVTLADWFHFMWDRFRGIRKDITQQALCCAESIRLVEMCARFHAHCAARLADLEHTQFDQKLNTDNLTKCLQTLKHMYSDVAPEQKPREAEFRGYIALLNLGDANFWWEIKHLPQDIQKSEAITFAIKVFNALDNNNYIRFFRLVKEKATYLQACILLRYFNDVRARALARIVKGFAPRGGSRYPAEELMNALAFETVDNMKSFVTHYGLRFAKTDESGLTVILDRNMFIEDSDPYPVARAPDLIESKRQHKVGAVIAGGQVPIIDFRRNLPYSSFNKDGTLKEEALTAQDQGYSTSNDSNKDLQSLRGEIRRLAQSGKGYAVMDRLAEKKANVFGQPESKSLSPGRSNAAARTDDSGGRSKTLFSFKPAIPVAPIEIINNSPEKMDSPGKDFFVFSKPQENKDNLFSMPTNNNGGTNVFGKPIDNRTDIFKTQSTFGESEPAERLFKRPETKNSIFSQPVNDTKQDLKNLVESNSGTNIFLKKDEAVFGSKNIFASTNSNIFGKSDSADHSQMGNIFGKFPNQPGDIKTASNVFGTFNKDRPILEKVDTTLKPKSIFVPNGEQNALSPGSLFKSAIRTENTAVAQNIFTSANVPKNGDIYDFNDDAQNELEAQKLHEQKMREEEIRRMEEIRKEEERRHELRLQEEKKRQEELKRKELELKRMEEERKKEEQRKQDELKRLLEEEEEKKRIEERRKAELKRKAEIERLFKLRVDKESSEVIEELIDEIKDESVRDLMKEELDKLNKLTNVAGVVTEEIVTQLCAEICQGEMLAEKIYSHKLMRKWFDVWRRHFVRNLKRRNLLEDTPVWITDKTPAQEASYLKRLVEGASLKNMNNIHRGYRFTGELPQLPAPEPLNLMEIIKSSLIKRMKHIHYSYDKGFFWKITLISPGGQWMHRKINIDKWLLDSFSDKKEHEVSSSLIYVGKQTWNQLMDFSISVSLISRYKEECSEAMEGTNSLLFYTTDNEDDLIKTIEEALQSRYPYQTVPVAVVIPEMQNENLEQFLTNCVNTKKISAFKIFIVESKNVFDSLTKCTRSALKWLAKNYPGVPPLEIDYLKSICERYLGNEIWLQLRNIKDTRMDTVMKDLHKLVQCYNMGVDKLTQVITDEDLLNYPLFPLELKQYLYDSPVYPKPYEYITNSARNSDNLSEIKNLMKHLKLPNPVADCRPATVDNMQEQIYAYCTQIGWFQYPEKSTLGVTLFELSDVLRMPHENFKTYFENFDFGCFLNLIVYEKINSLRGFENRYAVYKKADLQEYRNALWLYELNIIKNLKHKALEYDDELDKFINAKRQKIALESLEYLTLDDKDCTLVEESIKDTDSKIMKYTDCMEAVNKLKSQLEEESKRSMELEKRLQAALLDL